MKRQVDGMGWVTLDWPGGEGPSMTSIGPGHANELAEMLRMASQPGADLETAQQRWWRRQEQAAARAPAP